VSAVSPKPLVSVVLPTNAPEDVTFECLQSIHEQTHERLELIVAQNGALRTFEAVERHLAGLFGARFERVQLLGQTEAPDVQDALNAGIEATTGDFVAIADGYDRFTPQRVELLLREMEAAGSEFAISLIDAIADSAGPRVEERLLTPRVRQELALAAGPTVGYALLQSNVAMSAGNFVLTSRLSKTLGGFGRLEHYYGWDYILRAVLHTEPVVVNEALYQYRPGRESLLASERWADVEREAVYRRFFRAVLGGRTKNRRCPAPENWPGFFEVTLRDLELWEYWAKEAGEPLPAWRAYDRQPWGARSGPARSFEAALRLLFEKMQRMAEDPANEG
jgi:glycosyltransferase involved in cell wall biosynthesis